MERAIASGRESLWTRALDFATLRPDLAPLPTLTAAGVPIFEFPFGPFDPLVRKSCSR